MGPRAGLDRCGKSRPTGIRSPDRPARSQSLYRLRYSAHIVIGMFAKYEKPLLASSCLSVCPSVRPSAWNVSAPTGRIFMKFNTWGIFLKSVEIHI